MSKIVLITGASTGFGRDTAETLALRGYTVYASMRDANGKNAEHAQALRAKGIHTPELDVTDALSIQRAVDQLLAAAGRIDVLINNAGVASAGVSEAFSGQPV